jgi:GNAT superfamily N-acetyltransferase
VERAHGSYTISDDPRRLDVTAIHAYLTTSYWASGIPRDLVERSVRNSLCLGVYAADGAQVGLVRLITDRATFAYLCDVYILDAHRGHGLGKAAVHAALDHPDLRGLRRLNLVTRDAHTLYARHGFVPLAHPERYMEKLTPAAYQSQPSAKFGPG